MEQSLQVISASMDQIFGDDDWAFVDCGAYLGDFSKNVLELFKPHEVIMIEGNAKLISILEEKFKSFGNRVRIENSLVSTTNGKQAFNIYDDPATSSILSENSGQVPTVHQVRSRTLSSILGEIKNPIFLKTDLQGLDLAVLKESQAFLNKVRVCVVEFIQYPLYAEQGSFVELVKYMDENNFEVFQLTDIHSKQSGNIAFGNVVFVRRSLMKAIIQKTQNEKMVQNEDFNPYVTELKKACEDRLSLIYQLDSQLKNLYSKTSNSWKTRFIKILKRSINRIKK